MIQKLKLLQNTVQNIIYILALFTTFCFILPFLFFGNISFYIWNGDLLDFGDFFWTGFYSIIFHFTLFRHCKFLRTARFLFNIFNLCILVSFYIFGILMQGVYGIFSMLVISIIPFGNTLILI